MAAGGGSEVRLERRPAGGGGPVAWLTVDYPERRNCLGSAAIAQLDDAIGRVAHDADLRALVVTGAGERAFVGGADLRELAELTPAGAVAFITSLHRVIARLRALPIPVLARIDGYCLGAGLELALGCDARVATSESTFGMPEVRMGVPSVIEAALLPATIGAGRARDLVMTGRTIDAACALQWGLISRAVPRADLAVAVEETLGWWRAAGREALRLQKELCRTWEEHPLADGVAAGVRAFGESAATGEAKSLIRRFFSSRDSRRSR